jgi:hypothetical protein
MPDDHTICLRNKGYAFFALEMLAGAPQRMLEYDRGARGLPNRKPLAPKISYFLN